MAFGLIIIRISLGVAGSEPVTFLQSTQSGVNDATVPMEVVITRHVEHGDDEGKHTTWLGGEHTWHLNSRRDAYDLQGFGMR